MKKCECYRVVFASYFVMLLILFIGLFSLYAMNKFYTNSLERVEMSEYISHLENSIGDFWLLIITDNLEDYEKIKSEIEFKRSESEILYREIYPLMEMSDYGGRFISDLEDFQNISLDLLEIQEEFILEEEDFKEKAKTEKKLRHEFRDLAAEVNDLEFTNLAWMMQYKSKEALYQYGDEKHLNQWLDAISDVENKIKDLNLEDEERFLDDVNSYKIVSLDMGETVIRHIETQNKKRSKIGELQEISKRLEEDGKEISKKLNTQSDALARNIFLIIILIAVVGILAVFIFQRYFSRKKTKKKK